MDDDNDFTGLCCGELLDGYQLENHIKLHHREIPADVLVVSVHGVNVVKSDTELKLNVNNNDEKAKDENCQEETM